MERTTGASGTDANGLLLEALYRHWSPLQNSQIEDPGSFRRGAFEIAGQDPVGVLNAIDAHLSTTAALYVHPASKLYLDPGLLSRIDAQADYLLRSQLASGCVSLIDCNIDSPPDTAFCVHHVEMSLRALSRLADDTDGAGTLAAVKDKLKQFLRGTIPCLLTGGIHTPNHRWVICGALALLYERFGDERLRDRADSYLAEGLDLNEAGEWTERSNAIYNAFCAIFLYHVARVFGYEDLLPRIGRNLDMMRYMLHPDGAIVTEYSSRQDRGEAIPLSDDYYIAFRLFGFAQKEPSFNALAEEALRHCAKPGLALLYELAWPEAMNGFRETAELPRRYEVFLNEGAQADVSGVQPYKRLAVHAGAPIVRYRHEDLSVTLMTGQPEFLSVQLGGARLAGVKLSLGWFGIAGVPMRELVRTSDGEYELSIDLEGSYRGPLAEELPGRDAYTPFRFGFEGREETHRSRLPVRIRVRLAPDGVALRLCADAVPNLFAQLAFSFAEGGALEGNELLLLEEGLYQLRAGSAVYRLGGDAIEIAGGADEHRMRALRNDRHDPGLLHLVANYTTPLQAEIRIRRGGPA